MEYVRLCLLFRTGTPTRVLIEKALSYDVAVLFFLKFNLIDL